MIAQLPMLFHRDPDTVLVVGLGSGVTVGSVLTHDVRLVDCAEISPSVIKASSFFSHANHHALEDRRLEIIPRDARNMLLTTRQTYDVVISQPSNPWISGESALFSQEWYRSVYEHLNEGGLFLQWVPSYLMAKRDFKVIIHTLRSVFPHISLWTSGAVGDLIVLGQRDRPLRVDYETFLKRVRRKKVWNDIERLELDPLLVPVEMFVMSQTELSRFLYSDLTSPLPANTDNLLITEYSTPKRLINKKKIPYFMEPAHLHGDFSSLMSILKNIDEQDLSHILKRLKQSGIKNDRSQQT
jgi:spermidine synthase